MIDRSSEELHPLPAARLAELDLPDVARAALARGLPSEVTISDTMPTVFSSALGDGVVRATVGGPVAGSYVIGSIRDAVAPRPHLATFVLERGTGRVLLLDPVAGGVTFVNSDVDRFLTCLDEFVQVVADAERLWDDDGDEAGEWLSAGFRARIASIDRPAVDRDGYWVGWIDDLLTA